MNYIIPQNFFYDLAQNYVPAVIIFCILFGLTLQFIPKKLTFFKILETISQTCLSFWKWLVNLAPIATFALIGNVAGTMKLDQLYDLSEFLILFFIGAILLIFWIIPVTISCFTRIHYKTIMYDLRNALIISAVTTLSVVALPYIQIITSRLINEKSRKSKGSAEHLEPQEKQDIIKSLLLINYPFAQLGNFFVYLFMIFAVLYFDHLITNQQYLILPIISFLSSIGSPTSSINSISFLSRWLGLPNDTVNLYVSLFPLIRYPQVLLSVMGFAFLSIIVSFSFFGYLNINYKRLLFHHILFFIMIIVMVFFLQNHFPYPGQKIFSRLNLFSLGPPLTDNVKVTILPPFDESKLAPAKTEEDSLSRIQRTNVIRIGISKEMRPFSFFNSGNELVGYDIAYAYALAQSLRAEIHFIPFSWENLLNDLIADKFDIAMSAIYVTENRLEYAAFTSPYLHSSVSVVAPQEKQNQFQTADQIKNIANLKIGIFNDPVLKTLIQKEFPNASIHILETLDANVPIEAFKRGDIDMILWSEVQTKIWTLNHPGYVSIVPSGVASPFLMAYMVQKNSPLFLRYLNYWLEIKKNEGFQQQMFNQWVLIRPVTDHSPRWSILHNVLGF